MRDSVRQQRPSLLVRHGNDDGPGRLFHRRRHGWWNDDGPGRLVPRRFPAGGLPTGFVVFPAFAGGMGWGISILAGAVGISTLPGILTGEASNGFVASSVDFAGSPSLVSFRGGPSCVGAGPAVACSFVRTFSIKSCNCKARCIMSGAAGFRQPLLDHLVDLFGQQQLNRDQGPLKEPVAAALVAGVERLRATIMNGGEHVNDLPIIGAPRDGQLVGGAVPERGSAERAARRGARSGAWRFSFCRGQYSCQGRDHTPTCRFLTSRRRSCAAKNGRLFCALRPRLPGPESAAKWPRVWRTQGKCAIYMTDTPVAPVFPMTAGNA